MDAMDPYLITYILVLRSKCFWTSLTGFREIQVFERFDVFRTPYPIIYNLKICPKCWEFKELVLNNPKTIKPSIVLWNVFLTNRTPNCQDILREGFDGRFSPLHSPQLSPLCIPFFDNSLVSCEGFQTLNCQTLRIQLALQNLSCYVWRIFRYFRMLLWKLFETLISLPHRSDPL